MARQDNEGDRANGASDYGDPVSSGGGGYSYAPAVANYSSPATPSAGVEWWKPVTYTSNGTTEVLASSANALIPTFSPDSAYNVGKWLGENFGDFSTYKDLVSPASSQSDVSGMRRSYFSKARAQQAAANLSSVQSSMGASSDQMGSGYTFLQQTIALLDKYVSAEGGISRGNYTAMMKDFDELTKGADSSYVELGRAFLNPTANGNPLMETIVSGNTVKYGLANARLFE
jgi:hypothetical protein